MHPELLARRCDYPILGRKTYLINNSLGAMHRDTPGRLAEFARLWDENGVLAWNSWFPNMARVADLVGRTIGAPAGSTILRANVADVLVSVASAIDFTGSRNAVVSTDLDWPGSHYLWQEYRRFGARPVVVTAASDGIHIDVDRVCAAVDEHTALVAISLVTFRSSTLIDPRPIIDRAHAVGALVLLDAYQGVGAVPIDVVDLDVDFCVGGSVKFLCGGPGNGWLYVRPALAETLRPAAVGWISHAEPFAFELDEIRYAPGVGRFAGGTPNVPAAYAAEPGYRAIVEIGVAAIRARSVSLTQPLLEDARSRGYLVGSPSDPAQRGGHVTLDIPEGVRVHDELIRRDVVVDYRPGGGLRIAPHFFSTAEECTRVLDEIDAICRQIGAR
ncbi:MAG TPA: aminotransferase class V-fold PLP-dependent enzyme [Mycobacteriales bacterium]|nr:aminotransferase class V-fold PLP-dependent enzyme [Mycobacteriales bacterium]